MLRAFASPKKNKTSKTTLCAELVFTIEAHENDTKRSMFEVSVFSHVFTIFNESHLIL